MRLLRSSGRCLAQPSICLHPNKSGPRGFCVQEAGCHLPAFMGALVPASRRPALSASSRAYPVQDDVLGEVRTMVPCAGLAWQCLTTAVLLKKNEIGCV